MRLQCCEQGVRDGLCGLVGSLGNDARVLRSASVSRTGPPGLPITVSASQSPVRERSSMISGRSPIETRPPDLATAVIIPVAFPAPLLATQVGMEIIATALVRIDILVDPFVTDMQSLLHRQPAADLLRTPLLARQAPNPFPSSGGNPRLGLGLTAGQGPGARLLRAVATKTPGCAGPRG